jgi:alkylation response protein AidB-like acyl-CoA dehydrogenase
MDLMPTDEQEEIASTAASFLRDRMPVVGRGDEHVVTGPEIDPKLWRECAELGWLSLGLAGDACGVGYGLVEEMMMFRELGRGLAPGPFLPGVLGAHLAASVGDANLAGAIASGEPLVALATTVGPAEIGARVSARVSLTHERDAELLLVCDESAAALVDIAHASIEPVDPVDGTVTIGTGRLDGAPVVASAPAASVAIFDRGLVLAAASAVGIAEALVALAVEYAGERQQFGRPIGANQAIKHRCADMALRAEGAFAQVCYAAAAVEGGLAGTSQEAAITKYYADEASRLNGEAAVQVHGAIGFTSEATPYRYVLRGHVLARCFRSRAALLDRIIGDRGDIAGADARVAG